jgi:hypothetical protein
MSFGWLIFSIFALLFIVLFFVPLFFKIDTDQKVFYLQWHLFNLTIDISRKMTMIGFAGRRFRKKKEEPPLPPPLPLGEEPGGPGLFSLLPLLFQHRSLAIDLIQKIVRYLIRLIRTLSISELRVDFSSGDPMINGICYGAIQGIQIEKVHLLVNFWGSNRFIGQFRLALYRIIIPTFLLLIRLPYFKIYRVIREIRQQRSVEHTS